MNVAEVREELYNDEAQVADDFVAFMKAATVRRHPTGPVQRFNQGRAAGCVDAEFTVLEGLPEPLRVGLFSKPRTFRARLRFASASSRSDREKDVRGLSIRVCGAPGPNLTPGVESHDFVLNSHPVMPVGSTREFLELLRALEAGGAARTLYFLTHPRAAFIGSQARRRPSCHLDISYWSTTPYLFGPDRAVKYVVRPMSSRRSAMPTTLSDTYLRDALCAHLAREEAIFDFAVQFRRGPHMPIEDASVEWSELESPYCSVARLRIPSQAVSSAEADGCEHTWFNPWHCSAEHRPLGNMNRARRTIYTEMARFRAEQRVARDAELIAVAR